MRHPLSGKAFIFYLIVWAFILIVHTSFLYLAIGIDIIISLVDSFVFNLQIAGFGFIYWYVVKFLIPARQGFTNVVVSHAAGVIIGIAICIYLTLFLLRIIFIDQSDYLLFINSTIFWRVVVGLFYLVLIIMIYYLLQYNSRIQQKEKEESDLQNMLRRAEMEMLKFQLNPHFIFNSLNSISSLTISNPVQAQEMVIRLSEFLRSSLGKNNPEIHSLKDEMNQMNLYLEIERVRFSERLELKEKIDANCLSLKLPNMLLQPLYENAIKFGLYEQLGTLIIETEINCENDMLKIIIRNNYDVNMVPTKGKGIGLNNIYQRLTLLYDREDLMEVKSENGLFEVHLLIPQK